MVLGIESRPIAASAAIANVGNGVGVCCGPTQRTSAALLETPHSASRASPRRVPTVDRSDRVNSESASSINNVGGLSAPRLRKIAAAVAFALTSKSCAVASIKSSNLDLPHRLSGLVTMSRVACCHSGRRGSPGSIASSSSRRHRTGTQQTDGAPRGTRQAARLHSGARGTCRPTGAPRPRLLQACEQRGDLIVAERLVWLTTSANTVGAPWKVVAFDELGATAQTTRLAAARHAASGSSRCAAIQASRSASR